MTTVKFNLDALIGKKMAELGRHLTLVEISEATGVSQNRLVDYRKNKAGAIKLETIATLCDFFDCEPGDLLVRVQPEAD